MARGSEYKDILQQPLNGLLDVRSLPDQMPEGSFRFRLNMACTEPGRVCRMAGWEKFLTASPYRNQDLHDQLMALQQYYADQDPVSEDAQDVTEWPSAECTGAVQLRANVREIPTLGIQVQSSYGARRLVVGTQSRLYVLNETTGNWRVIGDGYGGSADADLARRFYAAQLGDEVFFTNDYDIPFYWTIDAAPSGCAMRATRPIADLETIGLSKASVITTFSGSLHLANVVMDGQRFPNRIVSSDFNDGTSFDPAKLDSITSFFDLDAGEVILAIVELGAQAILFTKTSIWIGSPSGVADAPFNYQRVYFNRAGNKCLAYRNTIIATGSQLIYAGADGFYSYDTYKTEPELVGWMDAASGAVFNGIATFGKINEMCCESHVAAFKPHYPKDTPDGGSKGEIWFSWAEEGSCVPSRTIVFNTEFQFVSLVDHGFSMFATYTSDNRISLKDWMLQNCFCDAGEQPELDLIKEPVPPAVTCPPSPAFIPVSLFSNEELVRYGITTEDWEAEADDDSLCALLNGEFIDDFCQDCNQVKLFIGASVADYCLKQIGTVFNRERCTNQTSTGVSGSEGYSTTTGAYISDGYYSTMISHPRRLGTLEIKNIKRAMLDLFHVEQIDPAVIMLRVGYSYNAYDPLSGYSANPNANPNATSGCSVLWKSYDRKSLTCPLTDDPAALVEGNLNPSAGQGFNWPIFVEGRFIYWQLIIAALTNDDDFDSDLVPALGGECCLSSIVLRARAVQKGKL